MKLSALFFAAALLASPASSKAAEPVILDDIATTCLESTLADCKVISAGFLNVADFGDNDGAPFLAWQTQLGSTEFDGVIGGFVLFEHKPEGWSVLDSGFDGYFEPPRLNDDKLLHVPGYGQGTGSFNADRLYQWSDAEGWQPIEMNQWLADVEPLLPAGLAIWKGVGYDFRHAYAGYSAETSLWRDDDANCCATGGSAIITLTIRDNALTVENVAYTPPAKSK